MNQTEAFNRIKEILAATEPPVEAPITLEDYSEGETREGDIRWVQTSDGPRLVLVKTIADGYASIILLHPYTEMACSLDVVVDRSVSRTPYKVVIQFDLISTVNVDVLGKRVGHIAKPDRDRISGVVFDGITEPDMWIGLKLARIVDPRWDFKAAEGKTLRGFANQAWKDMEPTSDATAFV